MHKIGRYQYSSADVRFVQSLLALDNDVAKAFAMAWPVMPDDDPLLLGRRKLSSPKIKALYQEMLERGLETVLPTAIDVIKRWLMIVEADVNEVVQHRRLSCRHCHGRNHRYQWRNADEFVAELTRVMDHNDKHDEQLTLPTDEGGYGFNDLWPPHDDCPACDGRGVPEVFIADTRFLSAQGRALYRGVKMTRNGPEVQIANKDEALINIAKALGMYLQRVELTGPNGGPLQSLNVDLPIDPKDAASTYVALMRAPVK